MDRKRSAWAAVLLAAAVALSACAGSGTTPSGNTPTPQTPAPTTPPASTGPKNLTIGMWSAPDSFQPITNKTTYGSNVTSLIYPVMLVLNDQMKFECRLCKDYKVSDDQTTFTFTIHPDAKWSDGKPITANDVAYTYGVIAHKDTPTSRNALITTIKGVDKTGKNEKADSFEIEGIKVVGDKEIQFTAKGPVDVDAFLEKAISAIYLQPKHVLETATDLKGLDKAAWVMNPEVTAGPYKFVKYQTESHIELAANPDYWLGKPKIEKVFLKIVKQDTFAASIEKGEIDFSTGAGTGEVPIVDWDRVSKLSSVTPVTYTAPSYQYLDVNTSKEYLANPKVRQAIATAINKELIVSRLLKGEGEVLATPINSIATKYYRKDLLDKHKHDPAKAKQLLTDAGWDFNREIVLLTPTGNKVREDSADIIQQNLQAAGMKVKIEKVDFATRQTRSKEGNFDISLVGFGASFDPDFSSQVMTGGSFNDRKYSNAELDELFNKGNLTAKYEDRKKIYDQIQEKMVEELPLIALYSPKVLTVVNKRVSNVKMGPWGFSWNAHEWDVK